MVVAVILCYIYVFFILCVYFIPTQKLKAAAAAAAAAVSILKPFCGNIKILKKTTFSGRSV